MPSMRNKPSFGTRCPKVRLSVITGLLCLGRRRTGGIFFSSLFCGLGHLLLDRGRPYRLGPCNKLFHRRMIRLHTSRIDPFLCGTVGIRTVARYPVRLAGSGLEGAPRKIPFFPSTTLKSSMTTPPKLTLAKPISLPCGSIGRTDTVIGTTASCKTASVRIFTASSILTPLTSASSAMGASNSQRRSSAAICSGVSNTSSFLLR